MAKLKVVRLEIAAPSSDKSAILDYLQRKGAVELTESDEDFGFRRGSAQSTLEQLRQDAQTVANCENALKKLCPRKTPLTAMLEPRKDMSKSDFRAMASEYADTLKRCERINKLFRQLENDEADIVRAKTVIDTLQPWERLDIPLHSGSRGRLTYLIGSIRQDLSRADILKILAEKLPETEETEIEVVSHEEDCTFFAAFCLNEDAEAVETALREAGFQRAPEYPDRTAAEKIEECRGHIAEASQRAGVIREAISNEEAFYDKVEFAKDYISICTDKYKTFSLISENGGVFFAQGYAAEKDAEAVKRHVEKRYDAAVEIIEPEPDEDVPVILRNNAFAQPLEGITGMYSLPSRGDLDPTGIMAFFYYFFFGMMLSDAGYGLIITALTGGVLLFKKNLERKMKNTCKMYLFCGISTMFWGAMYGSWFGDAPSVIAVNFLGKEPGYTPAFFRPWWTDAVTDLMHVLILCFIFGLVHLFVGVALKGITELKAGQKFDAFCDTVPVFLTIIGISPVFFNLFVPSVTASSASGTFVRDAIYKAVNACLGVLTWHNISYYILIVGLLLIIATGGRSSKSVGGKIASGLYEVYNIIGGYLGDVLSYARLVALGLATGIIAQVMNLLGTIPENPAVKLIMFIAVFIVGHVINLAINIIGAYVHTNRLQYVEFFGKFYEGGGRAFVPLKADTQYYKFKEDK